MGKQPTSSTQNTFPPWLMKALQPLIGGAASGAADFGAQGRNILQGLPAGGAGQAGGGGGNPYIGMQNPKDPALMNLLGQIGGAGKTKGA
jgi:hypothetical protein